MASQPVTLETFNLVHPDHYAELGYPHAIWTRLRREDPVSWWERTEGLPYWVITKHRDITEISTQPEKFLNGPRLVMQHLPEQRTDEFPPTLIQLDPPRHRVLRKLINHRFKPQALKRMHPDIERIGKEIVDALVQEDVGECDFVKAVSAPLPIAVIAWLLGVPRSDWELLFDWTNRIIGAPTGAPPRPSAPAKIKAGGNGGAGKS